MYMYMYIDIPESETDTEKRNYKSIYLNSDYYTCTCTSLSHMSQ